MRRISIAGLLGIIGLIAFGLAALRNASEPWDAFVFTLMIGLLCASLLGAILLGLQFWLGLLVASTAMAGDLFSSFVKRRLNLGPSSKATGLDQIPESLFPLLACRSALSLTALDIALACAIFFAGQVLLSRLFFWLRWRDRPY